MKTVFIINPKAGKNKNIESFVEKLKNEASKAERDIEIYITKSVGDATEFVKDYCDNRGPARFIACGGDGTFNEVLNGAIGFCGAEVGVFPMGTGNDFCRNFGEHLSFKDIFTLAPQLVLGIGLFKTILLRYKSPFKLGSGKRPLMLKLPIKSEVNLFFFNL